MNEDDTPTTSLGGDRRGVTITDKIAVGTLLAFTVLIAAGLGASVIFNTGQSSDDGGPPQANFTYQFFDDNSALLITYDRGDTFKAGEILLSGSGSNVTWARAANSSANLTLKSGDTIRLADDGAFGSPITSQTTVEVFYTGGNGTVKLDEWTNEV